MAEWLRILHGNVPGGLYLLFTVLIVHFFISLFLWKTSPLFDAAKFRKWFFIGTSVFILIYALVWRINPPIIPKDRIVIGPVYGQTISETMAWSEWLKHQLTDDKKEYYGMTYDWIYPSLYHVPDSLKLAYFDTLKRASKVRYQIYGKVISPKDLTLRLILKVEGKDRDSIDINTSSKYAASLKRWLSANQLSLSLNLSYSLSAAQLDIAGTILEAFYQRNYKKVVEYVEKPSELKLTSPVIWALYCEAKSQLAYRLKKNSPPKNQLDVKKTDWEKMFIRARKELLQLSKQGVMDMDVLLALAHSYLLEEKFGLADVFLKQAIALNPNHYKIFYLLSFLHPSRLHEIHFSTEEEVLERAWYMNPVDEQVNVRFAHFLFETTAPVSSDRDRAIDILDKYLRIQPYSFDSYMKLGYFYMYRSDYENAERIYQLAHQYFPDNPDIRFNLAILAGERGDTDKAIQMFNQLKDVPGYEDAYVYLGKIYKESGQFEKALEHFRKRVKLKKGDDDEVAREAMKGIRQTLMEMEERGILHEKHTPSLGGK